MSAMQIRLVLFLLSLPLATAYAQGYQDRFEQARERDDRAAIEAIAEEWPAKELDNPEAYILPANYYFASRGLEVSTKTGNGIGEGKYDITESNGGFAVVDPNTGKQIGAIGPGTHRDPADVDKAVTLLTNALQEIRSEWISGVASLS